MYRLLIVDSRASVCERVRNLVDWDGYGFNSILTASSYNEAMDIAVDLQPHVVLSGLHLGERLGYDLARQLRSAGIRSVFAIMAESEDAKHMRKAMQAGVRDYFLRPVRQSALQAFVERTIVEEFHGWVPRHANPEQNRDPVLGLPFSELSPVTSRIILYIMGNFRHSLSLTAIAENFNMSSKYIGRVFLKDTGVRFTEYLMAYRMTEARHLIVSTREKISVIAGMVGYTQLNNFYTHFKNYHGASPSALRKGEGDGVYQEINAQGVL